MPNFIKGFGYVQKKYTRGLVLVVLAVSPSFVFGSAHVASWLALPPLVAPPLPFFWASSHVDFLPSSPSILSRSARSPSILFSSSQLLDRLLLLQWQKSVKTSNLRHRCGRKKNTQERDQRRLTRIIKRDRRATLPQIVVDFNAGTSTSVTVRTIQRNIIDMGFLSRRSTRKRAAWSDESCFQLNRADGRVWVWRRPYESMDPTCQQGTVQADGGSVIVWGVCSWRDMEPLIRLDTTLIGDRYVSILSNHLHPFMSIVHSDRLGEFQQDNVTSHTSRITTYWLHEHPSEFRHFRCPPKSPRHEHY
ncbi:transposable element Tcb2 transposase [Trichonephila clavipes]|nr:transposable element Tcb2 transposase [Trichonephila clavipes]